MKNLLLCILSIQFLIFSSAHAAKKFDVEFKDQIKQGEKNLVLNGVGIRLATIFNVKVYIAGLYLEEKSSDSKTIIDSKAQKQIQMVFKRDVDKEKIQGAWSEGFQNQCQNEECKTLKPSIEKLNSLMADMKEGQTMVYKMSDKKTEVLINGELKGAVEGSRIGQILLGCFIGAKPPNEELKNGMLGK